MEFRRRRDPDPEINITSLVDVVFMLLIFFMVTTTFSRPSQLKIELPRSSAEQQETRKEDIEISIDASGRFFVNGRSLVNTQLATLKQALTREMQGRQAPLLVISADGKSPHQAVVTAMDAARQLGLTRLTFATARVDEDQP